MEKPLLSKVIHTKVRVEIVKYGLTDHISFTCQTTTYSFRHATLCRTPLDEWSPWRSDLYLTTHNTHKRQACMPPTGFELAILASERPQAHSLDRVAIGICRRRKCPRIVVTLTSLENRVLETPTNICTITNLCLCWVLGRSGCWTSLPDMYAVSRDSFNTKETGRVFTSSVYWRHCIIIPCVPVTKSFSLSLVKQFKVKSSSEKLVDNQ
jgi:hypothetical protein